ncbi:MAG: hypothetical protein IMF06_07515, partial [Proteobacteria bacterium]|nr:hypothetical protein [Pseudomonadota bacterium]
MDTVLLVLGILGFGAIVVAAYVFTVAARNYVSDHNDAVKTAEAASPDRVFIERNRHARRQEVQVVFPITVNGTVIPQ